MSDTRPIVTALGKAELDRVLVRGHDLNTELLGNVGFTDMVSLILRGRLPTDAERRMLDALLVILVEHGLVTHVVAARFVYHNAPEAVQAAVAAALLGAGSKHLGSSEWCARMLQEAVAAGATEATLDEAAGEIVDRYAAAKRYVPGIGHRTHNQGDPRAERLFEIARETGAYGIHCRLLERIAALAGERRGRLLPVNVTGAIAAIASDMGFRWEMTKSFALIGRTLGALGHIQEEMERPMVERIKETIAERVQYADDDEQPEQDERESEKNEA
jgi:citrate synthase